MIFEILFEAMQRQELILIEGGMCRFHQHIDSHIIIHEIISIQPGAGKRILTILEEKKPLYIMARCPADLKSNLWYKKQDFTLISTEIAKSGRKINVWAK